MRCHFASVLTHAKNFDESLWCVSYCPTWLYENLTSISTLYGLHAQSAIIKDPCESDPIDADPTPDLDAYAYFLILQIKYIF